MRKRDKIKELERRVLDLEYALDGKDRHIAFLESRNEDLIFRLRRAGDIPEAQGS